MGVQIPYFSKLPGAADSAGLHLKHLEQESLTLGPHRILEFRGGGASVNLGDKKNASLFLLTSS